MGTVRRLAALAAFLLVALLPISASAVLTKISVTEGGQPVESFRLVIQDASGAQVGEAKQTDRDGAAYFDLAPGQSYTAVGSGVTSAPFQAGDKVALRTGGGPSGIKLSIEIGGGYADSDGKTRVDGMSEQIERQLIRTGPFFDSPVVERLVRSHSPFQYRTGTSVGDGVGWLGVRADLPPCGCAPWGMNPFLGLGSTGLFSDPSESHSSDLGGMEGSFRARIENDLSFSAGVSIPVLRDSDRLRADLGGVFAWQEVGIRARFGEYRASRSLDVLYLGPSIGASYTVFQNGPVEVAGFVRGEWLFPVGGESKSIALMGDGGTARFRYEAKDQGRVVVGVRASMNVLGGN